MSSPEFSPEPPPRLQEAMPNASRQRWDEYLTETRAFFSCRAATWDTKFGDDLPGYAAAIAEAGIARGGVVIDVGFFAVAVRRFSRES